MFYLQNIKTDNKTYILGECPTCNYELGYHYGSNWRSHPLNCSFASYSPCHIACPKCETTFKAGYGYEFPTEPEKAIIVYSLPENLQNLKDWQIEFIQNEKLSESLEKEIRPWLPIIVEEEINKIEVTGDFYVVREGEFFILYFSKKRVSSFHTNNLYYFGELFQDPKKTNINGALFNFCESIKLNKLYCPYTSNWGNEFNKEEWHKAQAKAWRLISKKIGKKVKYNYFLEQIEIIK